MMIGFTGSTEGWGKILNLDKSALLCINISDRIAILIYFCASNFKNTVNNEVVPHVR
jgi:hypothetical protein